MKTGIEIKINWELLGAELAQLSSNEQNAFFNGFTNEMLKYETRLSLEIQLDAIQKGRGSGERELTRKQLDVLKILCEGIEK